MADEYEPELGQMAFGQPYKQYAVPLEWELALDAVRDTLSVVKGYDAFESPFTNSGAQLDAKSFRVHAYSWGDEEQPWNFKWLDIEISWYKHSSRGLSSAVDLTFRDPAEMLRDVLPEILGMEPDDG